MFNAKKIVYLFFIFYALASLFLFFYSYTQVDLNLTLAQVSIWQTVQKFFQQIGYFRRSLSLTLYLSILGLWYLLYGAALHVISKKNFNERQLWLLIGLITLLLVFAYPAFSYDFFNYMFTAKTVLVYQKNPYQVVPLQFAGVDPYLTFMRWTHLPSAYTPLWILLTLPAYLLGFGYFLLIMWNIKILVSIFYLLTIWLIGKILVIENKPQFKLMGMAIFALNPLVIIETLVSGHNDIAMMAVFMMAIYLYLKKRKTLSYLVWALSVGFKTMTIFVLPVLLAGWQRMFALTAMLVGLILVLFQREVLPWYWIWIVPLIALLPEIKPLTMLTAFISFGLLLRYAPFLYFGDWSNPAATIKIWVTLGSLISGGILSLIFFARKRKPV